MADKNFISKLLPIKKHDLEILCVSKVILVHRNSFKHHLDFNLPAVVGIRFVQIAFTHFEFYHNKQSAVSLIVLGKFMPMRFGLDLV